MSKQILSTKFLLQKSYFLNVETSCIYNRTFVYVKKNDYRTILIEPNYG